MFHFEMIKVIINFFYFMLKILIFLSFSISKFDVCFNIWMFHRPKFFYYFHFSNHNLKLWEGRRAKNFFFITKNNSLTRFKAYTSYFFYYNENRVFTVFFFWFMFGRNHKDFRTTADWFLCFITYLFFITEKK